MLLPKKMDPNEQKNNIRNFKSTDSVELNQYFYNGSFTYFDGLSFQVQIEKKQLPSTVTKLNTVQIGISTDQPSNYD